MGFASDGSTFANGAAPTLTKKALLLRNLVLGSEFLMSHVTHFYHLAALDYVQGPMIAPFVKNDLTGTFNANYYHPALQPGYGATDSTLGDAGAANQVDEINRMRSVWAKVIGDYILALHIRRLVWDAGALLSGGLPMYRSLVAGGTATVPTVSDIETLKAYLTAVKTFIDTRYVPLTQIVALIYSDFDNSANSGGYGAGLNIGQGCKSFLAWGAFNLPGAKPGDAETQGTKRVLVRGYMADADASPTTVTAVPVVSGYNPKITEYIAKSKYTDDALNLHPKHPFSGYTDPDSGKAGAYSWGKAPRLKWPSGDGGDDNYYPCEVGPLARMNVSQLYKKGDTPSQTTLHGPFDLSAAPSLGSSLVIPGLGVSADTLSQYFTLGAKPTYTAGISVMDRHR
ncbi:MAG: nickel-dependent hydrogenase large subunit, partial [Actinomycetia bacterium]|nr:nickel-dependent hydrogenase large subunit [Actinomycetes bacterium]